MHPEIFIELSKILIITLVISGIIKLLKQPLVIGYILSGIIVGPVVLNIIVSQQTIAVFSQIGVALLLFVVGLGLNPKIIKEVGKISLLTGLGQVLFTSVVGYFIAIGLGFSKISSIYIGIALAFSSTIIIMKLLSDKRALDTLYGKISIGFLIVQDFVAIALLLLVSSIGNKAKLEGAIAQSVFSGAVILAILIATTIYVLPKITKSIAKSQELLLLFSIGWCFAISSAFYYLNLSIEAGALIAGITLSTTPFNQEIGAKMRPLRDFFLILFFILLGSQMMFSSFHLYIIPIIIFSAFILIGNPIIVMLIMGYFGYTKRTSFLAGLTVAQISEFSLIFVALGVSVGHLDIEILSFLTAVGLITFAGSTYMIMYSDKLYPLVSKYLSIFERKCKSVEGEGCSGGDDYEVILFGYNRVGFDILESLKKIKKNVLIVDYNPEVIATLANKKYTCLYGDVNDSEFLDNLEFSKAKMVISTIPITDTNLLLIDKIKKANEKTMIAVVSHEIDDAIKLYNQGATYVLMPHFLGGKHFSEMLEKHKLENLRFLSEKLKHIKHLKERKNLGHEHPKHEHN